MSTVLEVCSPVDGRVVGKTENLGPPEVKAAATALRAAQPEWESIGPEGRSRWLLDWLDWLLDHERTILELVQAESGKTWGDATLETTTFVELVTYYTRHGAEFLQPRRVRPHSPLGLSKRLELVFRPHPLVGVITPWNGPVSTAALDCVGALMAGAAVLSKPSEVAPLAWTELARGWADVGAPPVLAVVNGDGATGAAVVDEVDMVMFTGSSRTGRRIAARAGERLIPASLELGGKDAMIVLADADLDRAAGAATWASMLYSGQMCVSVERVYVEAPVHDAFVDRVVTEARRLRQGTDAPGSFSADVGAMATAAQLALVESHVADALAKGARALTGGRRSHTGLYFEPTVLVDVDHSMACMREETFGPILPIMKVTDEAEALRLANDSLYGLSASVWTGDAERGRRVACQVEAGAVNINTVLANAFQLTLPMGGWKESGIGARLGGANGVLKFCRAQALVTERLLLPREPFWFPQSPRKGRMIATATRMLRARDWRRRLGLQPPGK